jgi:diguanylate cyclase (GGDEF)-like protein
MAMLLFQVDGFDKIFVQQGKPVGGAILKAVTAALQAEIRREDTAARISMARFGLVTYRTDEVGARSLAARVCQRIAASSVMDKDGAPLKLSVSASVVAPAIGQEPRFEELLTLLAKRLERAMAQGGCVIVNDSGDAADLSAEPAAPMPETQAPAVTKEDAPASETATDVASPAVQQTASPDLAPPSIDEALRLLAGGDTTRLTTHMDALARQVLPLLLHWNRNGQRGLDEALEQIQARLARD